MFKTIALLIGVLMRPQWQMVSPWQEHGDWEEGDNHICCCCLREGHTALDLQSSHLSLLNAGISGINHHIFKQKSGIGLTVTTLKRAQLP